MQSLISVIIPTLNEEEYLGKTLTNLYAQAADIDGLEVLVIDAGSSDKTQEKTVDHPIHFLSDESLKGYKYKSLNKGASKAKGDILLFLDADTLLPKDFDLIIRQSLQSGTTCGAFDMKFARGDWKYKLIVKVNQLRYRVDKLYFGDQAVFCRKKDFDQLGGFPHKALMESAYLCKSFRKIGHINLAKGTVITSPRRFEENGFWKVAWFDLRMWLRFVSGGDVDQFGKAYWQHNA